MRRAPRCLTHILCAAFLAFGVGKLHVLESTDDLRDQSNMCCKGALDDPMFFVAGPLVFAGDNPGEIEQIFR